MKKTICIILTILLALSLLPGCGNTDSDELAKLREENELLRQELANSGMTIPESSIAKESDDTQSSFEPLYYSGNGDKIISNVNLPHGIFVASITVSDESTCSIKYHLNDDDYELLYYSRGSCYKQESLVKGSTMTAVTDGILEIKCKGDWAIDILPLSGTSSLHTQGIGSVVTGIFQGTGKKKQYIFL